MPAPSEETLGATVAAIVRRFDAQAAVRDRALAEGRQIVRLAANGIRAVHRGEDPRARSLEAEARERLTVLLDALRPHPALYWAGYVQDAMKEYAEAAITRAMVAGAPVPGPAVLGVEDAPYLNGLAEAASELRREILDRLREGDLPTAERLFATMDEVYAALVTVDFADAVTGGLRRTTDQLRGVLERTRGDLTTATTQQRLEAALGRGLGTASAALARVPDDLA
jgi:translin